MASPGELSSYDLTVGVIVDVDEAIYMYSPEQLPLLTGLAADGLSVIGSAPVSQTEFGWFDEENLAPRSETTTVVNSVAVTFVLADQGERDRFQTGDVIALRNADNNSTSIDETVLVTGYNGTTDLLVTRDWDSLGTATTLNTSTELIGVGTALAEGSDPEDFRSLDRVKRTNVTQIFGPYKVEMTRTAQVVPRYGVPDEWAHQLMNRMYEAAQAQEQAMMYGNSYDDGSSKRTMGGLTQYITANLDVTNTQLNVSTIDSNLENCWDKGDLPDRLLTNPKSLTDLNDLDDTTRVRTTIEDPKRGRVRVMHIETEWGSLPIVRSRWVSKRDAFGIKRDLVTRRVLRPRVFERLAKTGDSDSAQFVCEESLQVKGADHMFRMDSLIY